MPITGQTTPDDKDGIVYDVGVDVDSVSEQIGQTTSGIQVPLIVDALAAEKWKQEMLGYSVLDGTALHRVLPEPYGPDPSLYCLQLDRAASYRGEYVNEVLDPDNNDWPTYETIRYIATFAAPLYEVKEDDELVGGYEHQRYCIWERKLTASNEKIPGGGFKFPSDNAIVEEVAVRVARVIELNCKWIDVPKVPFGTIKETLNKVNNAPITLNRTQYADETVLFKGVSEDRRRNAFGQFTYDITYTFLIRADGRTWNQLWRVNPAGEVVYEAPEDALGNKIFAATTLHPLWSMGGSE